MSSYSYLAKVCALMKTTNIPTCMHMYTLAMHEVYDMIIWFATILHCTMVICTILAMVELKFSTTLADDRSLSLSDDCDDVMNSGIWNN